jgi:hypothetical protein
VGHVLAELALESSGEVGERGPGKGLHVDLHACRVSVKHMRPPKLNTQRSILKPNVIKPRQRPPH